MRGMWAHFITIKKSMGKKVLADAAKEKQGGTQGQWQQGFKEVLEQVNGNLNTDCDANMMRRAYHAEKSVTGRFQGGIPGRKASSASGPMQDSRAPYDRVASEDIGRLSIARDILQKSFDFLRRIIAPIVGMGGATLSYVCPHCNRFSVEDYIWWLSTGHGDGSNRKKKHCSWWCAVCGGQYERRAPNRILVVQLGTNANEAKVFKAHAAAQGLCDNLMNALKLPANQQRDGDSPIQSTVTGLHERSRKGIVDGLRSFIEIDNHSAVDVGHLRRGLRPFHVQKPKFSEDYPEAAIREGADELTESRVSQNTVIVHQH